jgi:hypothetical protein
MLNDTGQCLETEERVEGVLSCMPQILSHGVMCRLRARWRSISRRIATLIAWVVSRPQSSISIEYTMPCHAEGWETAVCVYYVRSNFRRNNLVLFISFLYLCFFIFSFRCLFTLIRSIPPRRRCTCSRNVFALPSGSEGSVTSVMRCCATEGSNATGGGGGVK